MGWSMIREGGHEEMERELERAYNEGCEDGYEKAMREMRGGYGNRYDGQIYSGDMGRYDGEDYGDRRGVKGTGPYARYHRR